MPFLAGVAGVAGEGPYGQAHEVTADGGGAYKTSSGWTRCVRRRRPGITFANCGAFWQYRMRMGRASGICIRVVWVA